MAGRILTLTLAGLGLLVSAGSVQAFGARSGSSAYYGSPVVYCPVAYPVVWICQPSAPTVIPLVPRMPMANPIPAPPSPGIQTKEPPLASKSLKAPIIVESRSTDGKITQPIRDKAKIGFWNLTGRDITLKIDGEIRTLARDRAVTLELGRVFVWQVDANEPSSERVPPEEVFHEVIIRK